MHGDTQGTASEQLSRDSRLRKRRQFLHVQSRGRRVHTRHFVLLLSPSDGSRLGVTVTKKIANAVGRNRVKRVVREVYRRNRRLFPGDADIVVIARRGAPLLGYDQARAEFQAVRDALRGGRTSAPRTGGAR